MCVKLNVISKVVCSLLIVLCFLFVTCKEPEDINGNGNENGEENGNGGENGNGEDDDDFDDPYNNPNAGISRDLVFSHNSGLYSDEFELAITTNAAGRTIYYSTDGSIPSPEKVGNGFVFKYEEPIPITDRTGEENVLATPENSELMSIHPDDPRGNIPTSHIPTDDEVPKATVIRVMAVDASGRKSGVVTKTYFIGNNLAGYGDTRIISLVSDPEGLVSEATGIMVRGASGNRWDGPNFYNFQKKGDEWERPAYLEIFEGSASSRSLKFSEEVGIRVRGGWSRATGQKSFTVYFKEQYGIKNLSRSKYDLIPGANKADGSRVDTFKGFMLRNGANDADYTKFYDVFLQKLLNDRSFATQAAVPCIVYLNGEYWGPYNLQERYSDNHTGFKYGVENENVISYDNGELDDGNPGEEALYLNLINGVINGSINYSQFCAEFDIDNFIDYWAAEIYINNEDWPQNNYRVWRTRNTETGNKYGDKKWRYQMFDTEFALGLYSSGSIRDPIHVILNGEHKNHLNNKLFKALLANEDFCRQFVNTLMDLYNVNFHPTKFEPLLSSYATTYEPLMGDTNTLGTYFSRWGRPWDTVFENKVYDARKYLNDIRNAMVFNYLPTYFSGSYSGVSNSFSIGNAYDVTISTIGYSAPVKVNTVTVTPSWTGKYYSGNPITVTASAAPSGYEFEGWTISGGTAATPSALTTKVNITGNAQIIANYKLQGSTIIPVTGITLNSTTLNLIPGQTADLKATVTPDNATDKTVTWVSNDLSVASVDSSGKVTAVSSRDGTTTITAYTTAAGITATCTVNVEGPQEIVLLDLAAKLQTLSTGVLDDFDVFDGLLTPGGGIGANATYTIINDSGTKKLQVDEHAMWGVGVDVRNIQFQTGDIIEIKGTYLGGPVNSGGVQLLADFSTWQALRGWWNISSGQVFEATITLNANEANQINTTGYVKLRANGMDPYKSPGEEGYIDGYLDAYIIEQIKVYRFGN